MDKSNAVVVRSGLMNPATTARIDALMEEHEFALQEHRTGTFTQRVAARKAMRDAILLAFKTQDKITRHACAEAVLVGADDADRAMAPAVLHRAHDACMNAISV